MENCWSEILRSNADRSRKILQSVEDNEGMELDSDDMPELPPINIEKNSLHDDIDDENENDIMEIDGEVDVLWLGGIWVKGEEFVDKNDGQSYYKAVTPPLSGKLLKSEAVTSPHNISRISAFDYLHRLHR
eukprot:TRINITY_DN12029_c0_g1_i2.p1 TRINITY_DN12029_c0_g1~~TRINITY_DN12029_c0_g1_i2.p1  ORF type:complete len:141 (-),score=38.53 TRINITY_DN12029_c0_g1_i2:93-485(-)